MSDFRIQRTRGIDKLGRYIVLQQYKKDGPWLPLTEVYYANFGIGSDLPEASVEVPVFFPSLAAVDDYIRNAATS